MRNEPKTPIHKMTLKGCEDERARLLDNMQTILDDAGDDVLTESQDRDFQEANTRLRQVEARLAEHRVEQDRVRNYKGPVRRPEDGFNPGTAGIRTPIRREAPAIGSPKSYANLFGLSSLSTDGWNSFDDFLSTIHSGAFHPDLRMAANEAVGSDGGYIVPEYYAARLLDAAIEETVIVSRCETVPMQSETLHVGGIDASDSSSSLFGGISGQWVGEGDDISLEDIAFRKIELHARKLACLTKASNEIRADGLSFETQLETALRSAIAWHLDYACIQGTGAGQPLGLLNDPAKIEVSAEVGQAADTIVYSNLTAMLARLHPRCFSNSIWLCSPTAIDQLLQLSVPVGTGGSFIPVMNESNGEFRMLSRPVVFTEKVPTLGTSGDIALVDPTQYVLGMRREMILDRSGHVYFTSDETAYRLLLRADGQGKWSSAYTPKNGDTQSWCVVMEDR